MTMVPAISADLPMIPADSLGRIMPMHLRLDPAGRITGAGPTMAKLLGAHPYVGASLFDLFDVRRPAGVTDVAHLRARAGERLRLTLHGVQPALPLRGLAMPMAQGMLLNLSFGIAVIDVVRIHALTDADFAPTDLAIEMLYLVEAKSAVMAELRELNLRLQEAKQAAEEQALTDTLTGLGNRRALATVLSDLAHHVVPFGLMHLDLDYFKSVNDTLGHAAGDHVLREVAQILRRETRSEDTVARVGGDEFVVVFPTVVDPAILEGIAFRLIAELTKPVLFHGQICAISASIGITMSTQYDPAEPERMQNDADQALYASKRAGRGTARIFHPTNHNRRSA